MKEGWTYKKLDDICTIVGRIGFRGYTKADLVNSSKDGAITLSPSNIIDGELDFSKCTYINWDKYYESPEIMLGNGDIVLVKTASIGKCAVVKNLPHEATLNPQFVVLKQLVGVPDFICYYLKSPIAQKTIKQMAGGVAIPTLSQKKLGMMIVPTPSQNEQQSIVEYLDSAFAKIDAMKANAEKALNEAKTLFQKGLEEAMMPNEKWKEKTLGDICDIFGRIGFRGYTTKDLVQSPSDGAISLSPSNIQDGKMDYTKLTYISWFKYDESPEIKIYNGDILLVKTGSSFGKSALVQGLPHEATINPQSVVLKNCKINNVFFAYQLRTVRVLNEFNQFVSGTAIPTFSQAKLSTVPIQYPSNDEQQSIVETLDSLKSKVDRLQENFDKISQECDALKQAILRQVFE